MSLKNTSNFFFNYQFGLSLWIVIHCYFLHFSNYPIFSHQECLQVGSVQFDKSPSDLRSSLLFITSRCSRLLWHFPWPGPRGAKIKRQKRKEEQVLTQSQDIFPHDTYYLQREKKSFYCEGCWQTHNSTKWLKLLSPRGGQKN